MASEICMIMSASRKQKPGGKGTEGGWRRVSPRADGREDPGDWGLGLQGRFCRVRGSPEWSVFRSPWEVTVVFPGRTAGESLQGVLGAVSSPPSSVIQVTRENREG